MHTWSHSLQGYTPSPSSLYLLFHSFYCLSWITASGIKTCCYFSHINTKQRKIFSRPHLLCQLLPPPLSSPLLQNAMQEQSIFTLSKFPLLQFSLKPSPIRLWSPPLTKPLSVSFQWLPHAEYICALVLPVLSSTFERLYHVFLPNANPSHDFQETTAS